MYEYTINKNILDKIISSLQNEYYYNGKINKENISTLKFFTIENTLFLTITYSNHKQLHLQFIGNCSVKEIIDKNITLIYLHGQSSTDMLFNQIIKNNEKYTTYLEKLFSNLLGKHNQQEQKELIQNIKKIIKYCPTCNNETLHFKGHRCHIILCRCGINWCYVCGDTEEMCKKKGVCKYGQDRHSLCDKNCGCPRCLFCKKNKPCDDCDQDGRCPICPRLTIYN